jgi:nucleoside transporter
MMFLEYSVRGMWYPFLASYLTASHRSGGLGFTEGQCGWVLGFANAVGAVIAPVIAGRLADRYLNAERALSIFHVIAAGLLFLNAGSVHFATFAGIMMLFSIAYVPTQSLCTSLALAHLDHREKTFPRVRMWGTIGWMATSAAFTFIALRGTSNSANIARIPQSMRCAAILACLYAVYAFFLLPKTPPMDDRQGRFDFTSAFRMLREPAVLTLMAVALPVAAIHTAYYLNMAPFLSDRVGIPLKWVGPTLAISQVSEVVFMFTLGPMIARFGYKLVLITGTAAQAARFAIYALDLPAPVVVASLALHGVAYACFFTTAILYVDRVAPFKNRHSAQTIFGVVLFGFGPALAGPYSQIFDRYMKFTPLGPVRDFHRIWWTQAAIATAAMLAITIIFRDRRPAADTSPPGPTPAGEMASAMD